MNALKTALEALSSNQSGHWGIVSDVGGEPLIYSDRNFLELQGERHVSTLHLNCGADNILMEGEQTLNCDFSTLKERLNNFVTEAINDGRRTARCVVIQFGNLSVEAQCSVIRASRAIREKSSTLTFQTIVIGSWNFFHLQEFWRKNHDAVSPAGDGRNVFFQGDPTHEDILNRLISAKLIADPASYFDKVCADMLSEFTSGDACFLEYIFSSLKTQRYHLESIESVFAQTAASGELADILKRRTETLSPEAWKLLLFILNHQFASRPAGDIHTEELRLSGLCVARLAGTQRRLAIKSPMVERILRSNWIYIAPHQPSVYRGNDLARTGVALNTAAYRLVALIENTLRNLIVLSLSKQEDWKQKLDCVHADTPVNQVFSNELLVILRQILESSGLRDVAFDEALQAALKATETETHGALTQPKKPKLSVIESARDWQLRTGKSTTLELASDSLVYFFTTASLNTILLNEKQKIYPQAIQSIFPDKHELINMLEQYRVIRDAVAHNQPLSLATVKRLEDMYTDIEKRICQSQAQA